MKKLTVALRVREVLNDKYNVSQEHACNGKKPFDSLESAITFCERYDDNCKGIYDPTCDGTSIFACGEITLTENPKSRSNGCTYLKKGIKCVFAILCSKLCI